MYSKTKIFNLALSTLLLSRELQDADTDVSNEAKVLRKWWDVALRSALEEMDLSSTMEPVTLELIAEEPNTQWQYVYKYPNNCAFFRRIANSFRIDTKDSHIAKQVALYQGKKAIYTNEEDAVAEILPWDFGLNTLSANAGIAISKKLAMLSASLITGKGAKGLREAIEKEYIFYKAAAQEHDLRENFNFEDDATISEFVAARTS